MNLGDPFYSCKGTVEQAVESKDYRMVERKSDWLIVLGVWESHIHGEAASKVEPGHAKH